MLLPSALLLLHVPQNEAKLCALFHGVESCHRSLVSFHPGGDQWPWLVLLISGVDLYSPSRQRALGQIWESNSPLLTVLLNRLGYALAHQLVGGDQPEPLRDALL